jgi:hypothetical protein
MSQGSVAGAPNPTYEYFHGNTMNYAHASTASLHTRDRVGADSYSSGNHSEKS